MSLRSLFAPAPRLALPALLSLCLFAPAAQARPEMAAQNSEARFAIMDADKDGQISREEFFKAHPQMKDAAFDAIDTDKNGSISPKEWEAFAVGHGKDGDPHAGGQMPEAKDGGKAPELLMPPREGK